MINEIPILPKKITSFERCFLYSVACFAIVSTVTTKQRPTKYKFKSIKCNANIKVYCKEIAVVQCSFIYGNEDITLIKQFVSQKLADKVGIAKMKYFKNFVVN